MLKTLRRKFVVTAMAAVTVLFLVLLGGLNVVNWWLNSRDTDMMLLALSEGEGIMRPDRGGDGLFHPPLDGDAAISAVYFTVRLDSEGEAIYTDVSRISSVTEEEAAEYAEAAAASKPRAGKGGLSTASPPLATDAAASQFFWTCLETSGLCSSWQCCPCSQERPAGLRRCSL